MDFSVLEFKHFVAPSPKSIIKRAVTDYELDFYIKGGRTITIDGRENTINAGDVSIRKPGQEVYSFGDYDCYIMTLDLSCQKKPEGYSRNRTNKLQALSGDSSVCFLPDTVTPYYVNEYTELLERLAQCPELNSGYSKDIVKQLLFMLNADAVKRKNAVRPAKDSAADKLYRYINDNFRNNISLETLSETVHMDASYLSRVFKKKYNVSPIEYVIRLRLDYASSLVANTDMTVAQISGYCGYGNVSFFIASYKKAYGCTPNEHRKNVRCP